MGVIFVKTVKYKCPYCGKKVSGTPQNDCCYVGRKTYGNPNEICRKCGKTYRNSMVIEAATALTAADRVPWYSTNVGLLLFETIAVAFTVAIAFTDDAYQFLMLLPVWAVSYVLISLLTRSSRQRRKDSVLTMSRERLKDSNYFFQTLFAYAPLRAKSMKKEELVGAYWNTMNQLKKDEVPDIF